MLSHSHRNHDYPLKDGAWFKWQHICTICSQLGRANSAIIHAQAQRAAQAYSPAEYKAYQSLTTLMPFER